MFRFMYCCRSGAVAFVVYVNMSIGYNFVTEFIKGPLNVEINLSSFNRLWLLRGSKNFHRDVSQSSSHFNDDDEEEDGDDDGDVVDDDDDDVDADNDEKYDDGDDDDHETNGGVEDEDDDDDDDDGVVDDDWRQR